MSDATMPDYIVERIRRPPPEGCEVVPGSTPVIAFGDVRTARVATLGLNPSKSEFLNKHGQELTGAHRRLATLACRFIRPCTGCGRRRGASRLHELLPAQPLPPLV
jgi:hypothetical protein